MTRATYQKAMEKGAQVDARARELAKVARIPWRQAERAVCNAILAIPKRKRLTTPFGDAEILAAMFGAVANKMVA